MSFPEEVAVISKLLKSFNDPVTVVELGACDGGDTLWIAETLNSTQRTCVPCIVSIEACIKNFRTLNTLRPEPYVMLRTVLGAIAAHTGKCDFWANHDSGGGFGSIYKPVPGANSVDESKFYKVESIPCWTFDDFCQSNYLSNIDLLWVDIHGAEKDMIEHGKEALKRTRYLFMEAVGNRMYEGAATRDELLAMLPPEWKLIEEFPWNVLLRNESL